MKPVYPINFAVEELPAMNKEIHQRSQRKNEHVKHAMNQKNDEVISDFDMVTLLHHSLPELNLDEIDLSTTMAGFEIPVPLYINAMTGGSEWTKSINRKLGLVAAATGIPMAVGSMHAAIRHVELMDSYRVVREVNPDGLIFANVGADVSLEGARKAVEMIEADALQIHINAPQELIMPEGDRDFKSWRSNIESIIQYVDVPVIVKEVGFGMSRTTIQSLKDLGVRHVDISGKGGTNFARIENARRKSRDMAYLGNWGISTVCALLESQSFQSDMSVMASGGISTPLDAVKCLALGARAAGMSRALLKSVEEAGIEETIDHVHGFHNQMKRIAVMTNAATTEDLRKIPLILGPELLSWMEQRQLVLNEREI